MKGIFVTNGFVKWDKFSTIYDMLQGALEECGCTVERYTNCDLTMIPITEQLPKGDFVLFWDKDISLAKRLEKNGMRVFNSAEALEICDDKGLTAVALESSGIKMPKTVVLPKSFMPYSDIGFIDKLEQAIGYPMVLKECHGSFGKQVYLISNRSELVERITAITPRTMLCQEFIQNSYGRDVRIQVVGDEVVAAAYRKAKEGDFIANVTNGGKMYAYNPSEEMKKMAIAACRQVGADFAGVDVLFGKNDEPVLCEINTNAHFKNLYDATGVDTSKYIARYITNAVK